MQNLLQAKYKKPQVPVNCIPRQRLFSLLDRGSYSRLTLISAPAGFGKTTLLSAWINQVDIPCAWLTLDVFDNDPHHFLSYVVNSLQSIEIQIDDRPDAGLTLSTENFDNLLISLLNQIANAPQNFVFILDDYHLINRPEVHRIIDFILEYLPENMRLIISGRIG